MILEKWIPVISEHTMIYKRPLRLFQKVKVEMDVVDWDDRVFNMNHRFIVNDKIIAQGTSKGLIVAKTGVISPQTVKDAVDQRLQGKHK